MGVAQRQKQVRAYRGQIVSPGRPTVAWRQDRVRFWVAIAAGKKTREAAEPAGVSEPVAHRWFRDAGGANPQLPPAVSNRYLSPLEREDIALWRAQGAGVREFGWGFAHFAMPPCHEQAPCLPPAPEYEPSLHLTLLPNWLMEGTS